MSQRGGGMPRLADQLNHLFATVPRPGGRELWTNEDAAAAINEMGVAISGAYISQLRGGKRDNPSARHLAALARLFLVPLEYFFDPDVADKIDADLRVLSAIRDAQVRNIALRAHGLSKEGLTGVAEIIEHIRRLEDRPGDPRPAPDAAPAADNAAGTDAQAEPPGG